VSDPFEMLNLPRALAVSPKAIESAYREASRRLHPDRGGGEEAFQEMTKASELLKSPSKRLKWALESGGGEWDSRGRVPMSVMDLFSPVAELIQEVDRFEMERGRSQSTLGRAVLDVKVPDLKKRLEEVMQKVTGEESALIEKFEEFDRVGWAECAGEMGEVARGLAFLEKWQGEIRAATGKLFQALLGGL